MPITFCGKIFDSDEFILIFGVVSTPVGTPIVITFDNQGKQIDLLAVHPNDIGWAIDSIGASETFHYAQILPNREIIAVDSTISYNVKIVEGMPDAIPETKSISVRTRKYTVSERGKIQKD